MKKLFLILVGFALAIGIMGIAGYAYAQADDPPDVESKEEVRRSGGFFGRGHWFGVGGDEGILHEYLFPVLANVFGFDEEQIQAFQKSRESMQSIMDEYTVEEIHEKMQNAFSFALDAAVTDGAITQVEADQMLERRQEMGDRSTSVGRGKGGRMPMGEFPFDENSAFRGRMPKNGFTFDARGGLLSEYMESALADALDISTEKLQTMKEEGFNLLDYAEENGLSDEDLDELMKSIYTAAINTALEDDAITKDQAEEMLQRLENFEGRMPFRPGSRGHGW